MPNDPMAFTPEGPAKLIGDNPFALIGGTGAVWIRATERGGNGAAHGEASSAGGAERFVHAECRGGGGGLTALGETLSLSFGLSHICDKVRRRCGITRMSEMGAHVVRPPALRMTTAT